MGLLAISFTPDEVIQQSIILVDHNNSTTPLRLPLVRVLKWLSLGISLVLLTLAGVAYVIKGRLLGILSIVVDDTHDYCGEVGAEIRALLAPGERWKLGVLGLFLVM